MRPLGVVFFDGPSAIDGARIVAIATLSRTTNAKTGPLIQTWILRADRAPTAALASGHDESVCGACLLRPILRGASRCYVQVGRAMLDPRYRAELLAEWGAS